MEELQRSLSRFAADSSSGKLQLDGVLVQLSAAESRVKELESCLNQLKFSQTESTTSLGEKYHSAFQQVLQKEGQMKETQQKLTEKEYEASRAGKDKDMLKLEVEELKNRLDGLSTHEKKLALELELTRKELLESQGKERRAASTILQLTMDAKKALAEVSVLERSLEEKL